VPDPVIAQLQAVLAEGRRLNAAGRWTKREHARLLRELVRAAAPNALECDPLLVDLGEPAR
jgi:hypothetical protein